MVNIERDYKKWKKDNPSFIMSRLRHMLENNGDLEDLEQDVLLKTIDVATPYNSIPEFEWALSYNCLVEARNYLSRKLREHELKKNVARDNN